MDEVRPVRWIPLGRRQFFNSWPRVKDDCLHCHQWKLAICAKSSTLCGCCTKGSNGSQRRRPGEVFNSFGNDWQFQPWDNPTTCSKNGLARADGRYPVNYADLKKVLLYAQWTEPTERSLIRNGPFNWMLKANLSPIRWWRLSAKMVPANQRSSNCWRVCWHQEPVWLRSMEKILMI